MATAYLVDGIRSPFGRFNGSLAATHPAELAGDVMARLLERLGVPPDEIDDVMLGCVNQIGPQTSCIARIAWLTAGLPEGVPGVTVDRRCGSSLQAVAFAAQAVLAGSADLVVAGGVENMSMVRIGSPRRAVDPEQGERMPGPFETDGWRERYGADEPSQFVGSDMVAERWALDRDELEELSARSHERATAAWRAGRFDDEVVPAGELVRDECVREVIDRAKMASLAPLREGGSTTAAMASQIADGAAALLVASEDAVARHGLQPLARFHTMTVAADDPVIMLTAPIESTRRAFERSGLAADDIAVAEVNEAFAPVVLAVQRETKLEDAVVNVNGGAIALGHPLGATGARLVLTAAKELSRRGERYALATMCEAGGQANTMIIERV